MYVDNRPTFFTDLIPYGACIPQTLYLATALATILLKSWAWWMTGSVGLLSDALESFVNLATSRTLMNVDKKYKSITLEADAHHLMTDVWTSAGVIVGVGLVWLNGWLWLDPAIALLVALNILWTGWQLLQRSAAGLMDISIPEDELQAIEAILNNYRKHCLKFHALRTRQAGTRAFITVHILLPGAWTIQHGHDWSERIREYPAT